jgi:hypothetical protein
LVPYHIRNRNYGITKLDGLDMVFAGSWPKAIHEGNGTAQFFITKRASKEQRDALVIIMSGKAKGEGPFAVFAGTYRYVLDPQLVDINVKIDGSRKSSFSIPGVMDVQLESFKNPVTGEEQDTKIQLPGGFIWKPADAAKSKMMRITTPNLNFNDAGKNAFYSVVEYKGP